MTGSPDRPWPPIASFVPLRNLVVSLCMGFFAFVFPPQAAPPDEMVSTVLIGNSRIDIVMDGESAAPVREELVAWVRSAAEAVAAYYGRFPLPHVTVRIRPFAGKGIRNGRTFGRNGGTITIRVGSETTAAELMPDWMLTHEMVHLAFPSVPEEHHWIEEGIATYVEPIGRVRAKHLSTSQMWAELLRDLPQGLPEEGDQGLDNTHTWGRTYWGGALFCLLADVEIHRQTRNQKGLEDALRGILNAGGDIRQDWKLDDVLQVGDRATGVRVLEPLYYKLKDAPGDADLADLWKQLGVKREGNSAVFDDHAPLAATRQAITCGKSLHCPAQDAAAQPRAVFAGRTARTPSD